MKLLYSGIVVFGSALTLTVAALGPKELPIAIAASGGLLAGTAAASEVARKREEKALEGLRVAKCFTNIYKNNRGIVVPEELAFETEVDIERINTFLSKLAQSQGGQQIPTETGVFYRFPHPESVLDQLTANATAWAQQQAEVFAVENAQLKQQLLMLQSMLTKMQSMPPIPAPRIAQKENPEEGTDPWEKLL